MALQINTSHPLYGNLICCIGVDGSTLTDFLTPSRTITPDPNASFGTGFYGNHFQSSRLGDFTAYGASLSPSLDDATNAITQQTTFIVVNDITASAGKKNFHWAISGNPSVAIATGGFATVNGQTNYSSFLSATVIQNNGAKSVAFLRDSEAGGSLYIDGSLEASTETRLDFNSSNTTQYLMGWTGQGTLVGKLVWFVKFNRLLTPTEISDLHTSLGADNAFALVTSGGPATVASTIAAGLPTPTAASTINVQSTTVTFTVAAGLPVPTASSAVTIVPAGDPIFTSEPLRDNTGTLLVSEALDYVAIYDNATGALVLRETGLSTNASGVFSVQSALLTSGVTYKVDWKVTSQLSARMPAKAAV